jgi:alpha-L-fucosidase 2
MKILPILGLLLLPALAAAELKKDIEYGRAGGVSLRLDASVPDGPGPFPVAILVHGGGWSRGDKAGSDKPGDSADITPWFGPLTAANFTWFSLNYRHAPQHRWPACLDDVQTAIRWVKAHAAEFKGDPQRIALIGHSAGGHLVCLAAVLAGADTRVQAVVGFAAVTNHEQDLAQRGGLSTSLQSLLDRPKEVTPDSRALLHDISPLNHVHAGLPPFLLIHGDADKSVPHPQSLDFQARLRATGNVCDLITIPGAPHGLLTWNQLAPDYPDRMIAWLRQHLAVASE